MSRGSETQLEVDENLDKLTYQDHGEYAISASCSVYDYNFCISQYSPGIFGGFVNQSN